MSDLKMILEKYYLPSLRQEMYNNFVEWNKKKINSPPYDNIHLYSILNRLIYSKLDEITEDFDFLNAIYKPMFINKLNEEFNLSTYFAENEKYAEFYRSAESHINEYKNLIEKIYLNPDLLYTKQNYTDEPESDIKTEIPESPNPYIFKNRYAYLMFYELKASTVKQKTIVADYSFIFHKMKHKSIEAINSFVTEPAFIKFLNTYHEAGITGVKLPFRNPDNKQPLYTTILDKYKANL